MPFRLYPEPLHGQAHRPGSANYGISLRKPTGKRVLRYVNHTAPSPDNYLAALAGHPELAGVVHVQAHALAGIRTAEPYLFSVYQAQDPVAPAIGAAERGQKGVGAVGHDPERHGAVVDFPAQRAVVRHRVGGSAEPRPGDKGKISIRAGAVQDHPAFVLGVFQQLWAELGGTLTGGVREGPVPAEARAVAVLPSPTLGEVVRDINKHSNNVMARQLFLTLGLEAGHRPASTEDADAAIRSWLDARGLALPELVLENGSGLSRRERISAEGLGRVLQAAWRSSVMPELMASLPVTATDGTMKKRLRQNGVAGQAHIKTGSLEGVRSIAGYVLDKTGRRWIVVFFVNHANAGAAQAAQDALLQWVYERGGA